MKKAFVFILILILAGAGAWFFFLRDSGDGQDDTAQYVPKDYPERLGDAEPTANATQYQSSLSSLAFEYPENWNVTESTDNSDNAQLLTVESPLDINRFYFCLDINAVSPSEPVDFSISEAQVKAVEALEPGHQSVIYSVEDLNGLLWGVTDEMPQVGNEGFSGEIVGASGSRMQIFGRFNCREDNRPDLSIEEFQNARWFKEAQGIVNSLEF